MTRGALLILWDNDGVLVDTEPVYFEASQTVLSAVGVSLDEKIYADVSLTQGGSLMDLARSAGFQENEIKDLRIARDALYSTLLKEKTKIRDGMAGLIPRMAEKARMGIVTSAQKQHFDIIHSQTGLLSHFEFVLTREKFSRPKPFPDAYLTALKKWNLSGVPAVVVEDTERGVIAAKEAGLPVIGFPHPLSSFGDFSRADAVAKDAEELEEQLTDFLKNHLA